MFISSRSIPDQLVVKESAKKRRFFPLRYRLILLFSGLLIFLLGVTWRHSCYPPECDDPGTVGAKSFGNST